MTWSNKIKQMLSPGRSVTGKLLNEPAFWTEVQRAGFLLQNLKDSDLNWGQPDHYLHRVNRLINSPSSSTMELDATYNLYLTWVSIAVQIDAIQDVEFDLWWLYKLDAAADHIFDRVFSQLSIDMQNTFIQNLPSMHRACNQKMNIDIGV